MLVYLHGWCKETILEFSLSFQELGMGWWIGDWIKLMSEAVRLGIVSFYDDNGYNDNNDDDDEL